MFNEAYAAVPLGEDIIKEYVMYTYDVPVSLFLLLFPSWCDRYTFGSFNPANLGEVKAYYNGSILSLSLYELAPFGVSPFFCNAWVLCNENIFLNCGQRTFIE